MTEKQANNIIKQRYMSISWETFIQALEMGTRALGLDYYLEDYTKKNISKLGIPEVDKMLHDNSATFKLNITSLCPFIELHYKDMKEELKDWLRNNEFISSRRDRNKTSTQHYFIKIQDYLIKEKKLKDAGEGPTKTPNKKKVLFKEAVENELQSLKSLIIDEPERLMHWIADLGRFTTPEVFEAIDRWGEKSNNETISNIKKHIDGVSKIKDLNEFYNYLNSLRLSVKAFPQFGGILFKMIEKYASLRKKIPLDELRHLLPKDNDNFCLDLLRTMLNKKMFLDEKEIELGKKFLHIEGIDMGRNYSLFRRLLLDSEIQLIGNKETISPKKPKLNLKESKENWGSILADYDEEISGSRGGVLTSTVKEIENFINKNMKNCNKDDIIDLYYCYSLLRVPSLFRVITKNIKYLKPEVKKEIIDTKKNDVDGILGQFFYTQEMLKKEIEVVDANKKETISPKKPKTNFKESISNEFNNLNENEESWSKTINEYDRIYTSNPTYRQKIVSEAGRFIVKNIKKCSKDDIVDFYYCYSLSSIPALIKAITMLVDELKPEVKKEIVNIEKADVVGISEYFFVLQRIIKKHLEFSDANDETLITPKNKQLNKFRAKLREEAHREIILQDIYEEITQ